VTDTLVAKTTTDTLTNKTLTSPVINTGTFGTSILPVSADGDLAIAADDEIDITSTLIDVNGNLDVSGTLTQTGIATFAAIPVFSAGINVSGGTIAGTLATAAQANITSLGTLTTLTVDNVITNGSTIGHTDDTDLITLADGIATVAGEVSMTTLDIGGTNVTATAAELNYVDGVTSAVQTQIDTKASTGKAIAMAIVFG
jgi:hypothetical protein